MKAAGDRHNTALAEAIAASKRTLLGLAIFSFFISILMLTGPFYMLQVYDRVLASQSAPTLVALTVLALGLYFTLGVLDWVRQSLFAVVASRLEDRLADEALNASLASSLRDPGRKTDRPLRDLRTVRRFLASPALSAMFDAPFAPIFFLALFLLHWTFGLWAMFGAAVLLVLALINQAVTRNALRIAEDRERIAQMRAGEMTRNVEVMDALGMRTQLQARWRGDLDASDNASTTSSERLSSFTAGTKAFRLFLQSAILGLGAWLVIQGESSPGAMIAASILMGRAIAPIEQMVGQWRNMVDARRAWVALNEAVAGAPTSPEPMPLPEIRGRVDFEAVSAGPPAAERPVLKQVSLTLEPGDVLGVIGPSGSGKSTFARILAGVWPAKVGAVRIDGAELSAWSRDLLGPQVGYLPQQVDLFSGSVRDNIARFREDAPAEAIIAAAQSAGCHDLILRLPEGYDTEIGEGGAYLSAGQRQRVGLARALFGEPNLVILDEPNSNLDTSGDEALQNAIARLKLRRATTVIIAHRPNAIMHCNKLMVLDNGQVRLFGPRDEVMAKIAEAQESAGRVTPIRKGDRSG